MQLEMPTIRQPDPTKEGWCVWRPGQKVHLVIVPWLRMPACQCQYWLGRKDIAVGRRQPYTAWMSREKVNCKHCRKLPMWRFGDPWTIWLPDGWEPVQDRVTALVLADYWDDHGKPRAAEQIRSFCFDSAARSA